MIIDCISDLHGHYPTLEGGDLLIVAGDFTVSDTKLEYHTFYDWMFLQQQYRKKIVIAGNHDNGMVGISRNKVSHPFGPTYEWFEYLCDSGTEFEGLKIWGSPWTKKFPGMNPHCMAFTLDTDEELAEKWALIPDDTDILVTHCPPQGILDWIKYRDPKTHVLCYEMGGSFSLKNRCKRICPRLHVFGHIHEGYGVHDFRKYRARPIKTTVFCNASHVDQNYDPVNKPIRVIL